MMTPREGQKGVSGHRERGRCGAGPSGGFTVSGRSTALFSCTQKRLGALLIIKTESQ